MKKLVDSTKAAFYVHYLLIIKIGFMTVVSLGTSWQASTCNINIATLTKYELFNIFVGMSVIWGTHMISLLEKIIIDFVKGRLPTIADTNGNGDKGNTQVIRKEDVNEKTTNPA